MRRSLKPAGLSFDIDLSAVLERQAVQCLDGGDDGYASGEGFEEASLRFGAEAVRGDRHRGAPEEAPQAAERGSDLDAGQMGEALGEREQRPAPDEKLDAPDARMNAGQNLIAELYGGARVAVAFQARIECDHWRQLPNGREAKARRAPHLQRSRVTDAEDMKEFISLAAFGVDTRQWVGLARAQDLDRTEPLRLGLVDSRFEAGEPARALLPPFRIQIAEIHHHGHGRRQVQRVWNHAGRRDIDQLEWRGTRTVADPRAKSGRAEIGDLG